VPAPIPADAKKTFTWFALLAAAILLVVEGISMGFDPGPALELVEGGAAQVSEDGYTVACESKGKCEVRNKSCQQKGSSSDDCDLDPKDLEVPERFAGDYDTPGLGVPADAVMSLWLFIQVALMAVASLPRKKLIPYVTGIVNIIAGILLLLGAIAAIFLAIAKLLIMLGLLFAWPFGPLIYLAIFGFFPKGAAAATLTVALILKIVIAVLLFLGDQSILKSPAVVILFLLAIISGIIVMFLHAIVPMMLVSITDAVAAIIVGIIAAIWAILSLILAGIVQLIGTIIGTLKARPPS